MGLLRRFLGGNQRPAETEITVTLYEGTSTLQVVGESFYQDALWRLAEARLGDEVRRDIYAVLLPEPDNEYDPNAVVVLINGLKVGHLSRDDASKYQPGLVALMKKHGNPIALEGVIAGGGRRDDGPGMLGVFLTHDPVDFGLPADETAHREPSLRTGLSAAMATDDEDDSYDLDWMDRLPENPVKRIPQLRALLADDPDPIDRHFMFLALEEDLYYCRDTFPTALTEFDEVCEQHHAEIETGTREALLAKFGVLPLIDTYKQSAIRHQKQHDWGTALLWAERGLAVYGDDAARPEAVADLEKRAGRYRDKLRPSEPKPAHPRPAPAATHETLTCATCGTEWEREIQRGRKPHECPECRG